MPSGIPREQLPRTMGAASEIARCCDFLLAASSDFAVYQYSYSDAFLSAFVDTLDGG